MRKYTQMVLTVTLTLILASCTRPQSETSKISISLPGTQSLSQQKVGSLSANETLVHVVINITGPGIQSPAYLQWSAKSSGSSVASAPASFELANIPQGKDRLIQVLAVYESTTTKSMSFYYGDIDSYANESASPPPVGITVESVGGSQTVLSGTVWGRYLTAANQGPTGEVSIRYNPGGGKPSLVVEKTTIANGWFEFLALSGAKFEYVTDQGVLLFGGPVGLDDPIFQPGVSTENVLRVMMPLHDRNEAWSGGHNWKAGEPEIFVFGWFGDSSVISNKKICRPSALSALTRVAAHESSTPSTTARGTFLSGIQVSGSYPTVAQLTTNSSNYWVAGGLTNSTSPCTTPANEYLEFMNFNSAMIDGHGRDGAKPFFKVYTRNSAGYPFTLQPNLPSAGSLRITGEFLPGARPLFDKLTLFKNVSSTFSADSEDLSCQSAQAGTLSGFAKISETGAGTSLLTATGYQLDGAVSVSDLENGTSLFVCGSLGSTHYDRGMLIRKDMTQMLLYQPTQLKFTILGAQAVNTCKEYRVQLRSLSGNTVSNSSGAPITVNLTASNYGQFYPVGCSSPIGTTTSVSIANGAMEASFYYKSATGGTATLDAAAAGFPNLSSSLPNVAASGEMTDLVASMPSFSQSVGSCKPLTLNAVDGPGSTLSLETGALTFTTNSKFSIHSDPTCSGSSVASTTLASGQGTVYVKSLQSGSVQIQGDYTSRENAQIRIDVPLTILALDQPTKLTWSSPAPGSTLDLEVCYAATFHPQNDFGQNTPTSGTFNITSSAPNGTISFYSDVSCTTPSSTLNLSSSTSQTFYFKKSSSYTGGNPSASITLTRNSGPSVHQIQSQVSYSFHSIATLLGVLPGGFVVSFGTVTASTTSSPITITLTNNHPSLPLTLTSPVISPGVAYSFPGGSFPGTGGTCSPNINAGASCTVNVVFTPASSVYYGENLNLPYQFSAGTSHLVMVALQGTGL